MTDPSNSDDHRQTPERLLNERLERIETALAHLQHDVEDVNSGLTKLFRRLMEMDERFTRLEHELESGSQPPDPRDPAGERPPHY